MQFCSHPKPTVCSPHHHRLPLYSPLLSFFYLCTHFMYIIHRATSQKVEDSRRDEVNEFFSIYLILPAVLGPVVYSTSNTNEYHKQGKKNVSVGSRAWLVRKADNLPPSVSRLSTQCRILDMLQPFRPPWPVTVN
jgi:hypothetical protein